VASSRKHRRGTLLLGLLLLAAGLVLVLAPAGSGIAGWLIALWPVFLICAGVVRVMGFAVERKPRSPLVGTLLIIVGVLFLAARFQPGLNALQIYGRFWVLLLVVYASVELVRFYSHRHTEGPPPRVFTPMRVVVLLFIVCTGVLANHAASNPSVLSALRLPAFLSGLRDSVVGETYAFTDQQVVNADTRRGMKVTINNSYGSVKVTGGSSALRATLVKGVRGWSQDEARKVADRIRLLVNQSADELTITTNRDQVDGQFTTDIQVDLPSYANVSITDSYGSITAKGIEEGLTVKASYGQAELNGIKGDVNLALNYYFDITAANIDGDLTVTGARNAGISNLAGSLSLSGRNGAIDLREISGEVHVDAPFSRITAQGIDQAAEFKTEHASVDISRAEDVTVNAPHCDVHAKNISGDLRIVSSNSTVQLASITGDVAVDAEQCSVSAEDVHGAVGIKTSHGNVAVKNFYEGVRVETSYRDVTLQAAGDPAGDIVVQNNHGQIKLVLPQSSQFRLDAQSASGQIQPIGFGELGERVRDSLIAALGSDGPSIKLRTSYKNIIIQASTARQGQATSLAN
jgi:DUF4097 and DUF4098 domain-containing protein YvlB/uncharacterized membrane protein HdeD (DUF308 family)